MARAGRKLGDRLSHASHSAFIQQTEGASSGPGPPFKGTKGPTQGSWRGRSDPEALSTWLSHFLCSKCTGEI